jgi:hypothetical protein
MDPAGWRPRRPDRRRLNTTFTFYDEAGHAVYLTGAEIIDTMRQLNYRYDDDPPPPMFIQFPIILAENAAARGEERIRLEASPVTVRLPLSEQARQTLVALHREPDRKVFLRIQDIRTEKPPSYYYAIYLNPPAGQKIDEHTPGFVGNLSLFSMVRHRMPDRMPMPGQEMSVNYDVSRLVDQILRNSDELSVILAPRGLVGPGGEPAPLPPEAAGTVGSVVLIER